MSRHNVDETSRLLHNTDPGSGPGVDCNTVRRDCTRPSPIHLCMVLYFLVEMYDMITIAPLNAFFEQPACQQYYQIHDPSIVISTDFIDEMHCKMNSIQAELALVRGWKSTFDAIPGEHLG